MNNPMKPFALILITGLLAGAARAEDTNRTARALTLRECVERTLANNLELRVERINPGIATWGVVAREGVFDPRLKGELNFTDSSWPEADGTSTKTRTLEPSLSLAGVLPTGTGYGLSVADQRTSGTGFTNFAYTGNAGVTVTQPLLKDFWFEPNTAEIRVARKDRAIAGHNFTKLVMGKVSEVSRAYYELVFAIENHKAKLEDLNQAKRLLEENRKRVQVGVLSPLDVTQAEAGVAEREEAVIIAERVIEDDENALKRLLAGDVSEFLGVAFIPTDLPVAEMVETDVARSTRTALAQRPEYLAAKEALESKNITVRFKRNQLWPQVDLQGSYGLNGRSDGGFDRLTDNQFRNDNPAWSVGVVVSVPLGNRQARAGYHIARLDAEQAVLGLKQAEQNIVVEVDNAVRLVRTNLKRVDATRVASRLAEESLKAEESKLKAGTSTSFLVLQAQSQLATARSAEIRARSDYSQSLIELARVEGTTLQKNNIVLDEKY